MSNFEMKGFNELLNKLQKLQKNAKALNGVHPVKLKDSFPPDFMKEFTRFDSIEQMFDMSGFKIESQEDFNNIPIDKLDEFVKSNTKFESWLQMQEAAGARWIQNKLEL